MGLGGPDPTSGEVGYWAHPAARGTGVTTEAVGLLVRHAFSPVAEGGLGLRRLLLKAAVGNDASQHVAETNGFHRTGVERQAERLGDGSYADLVDYDLLVTDGGPDADRDHER
jgi:RimJ/RimL family protein N-acetyltransferase